MSHFGKNNFGESPDLTQLRFDSQKVRPLQINTVSISSCKIIKIWIDSKFYTQSCNLKRGIGSIVVGLDYKPLEIIL